MGYTKDAVKGISWIGGLRVITRVISYVRTAIIARILSPSQFGIFSITTIVLSLLEIVTETGINAFLIQHDEDIEKYLSTAWVISILRGFFIAFFIFLLAPFIASFFRTPDAVLLIQVVSIVPLIRGFINPAIVRFQKDLKFHKEFYYRASIFFVESFVSIILVFLLASPLALVWGLIAGALFEVSISYLFVKPFPQFAFDFAKSKYIIHRGKWLTLTGIFSYLFHNGDNIVVGRVLGASSLGIYDMAYKLSTLPITEVSVVINQVTFPVYVKIGEERKRLWRAFLRTLLLVTIVSVPIGLILIFFAKEIILIVLGSKWTGSIPVLQVLAVFGVVQAIASTANSLFMGLKKQEYVSAITLSGLFVLAVIIIPFVTVYGLIGVGYAVTIATVATVPVVCYYLWLVFRKPSESA